MKNNIITILIGILFILSCCKNDKKDINVDLSDINVIYNKNKTRITNKDSLRKDDSFWLSLDGSCVNCIMELSSLQNFLNNNIEDSQKYTWYICLTSFTEYDFLQKLSFVSFDERLRIYYVSIDELEDKGLFRKNILIYLKNSNIKKKWSIHKNGTYKKIKKFID